jgi:hypothetical protein
MPDQNHLIIGLGGTGGNIIRSFRKTVYEAYGSDLAPDVNLRYLFVDTSPELMDPEDPSWKILGHSVQLPRRSQLQISGINLKDVVSNLNQYPSLKPWLGNRDDWNDILNTIDAAKTFGAQKRRLGRFLFATNAGSYRERVTEFVLEMQQDKSRGFNPGTGTTFHVCCGLAGGTGSGSVIDAICQIRAAFPDPQYRIIVYALLPERNPEGKRAGPNYHANGYAALVELNALSVGCWSPHDILSTDGARLKLQDPFNCCYLFNDENEANVAVSIGELPDIVASFLFQKIVQVPQIHWGQGANTVLRQETFELGAQAKEMEKSARGTPRRSRSFFSFGVKQIAYPEVEIREYLTYSFALQAVRQLLYNRWVDGEGFTDEPVNQSYHEYVRSDENLGRWYLKDERLTLSVGILPSEISNKKWKPIADFWKALVPNYVTHVLDQHKDNVVKMLSELTNLCETAYLEQYRGSGVQAFYEIKRKEMADHIRELRGRIEAELFSDWRSGARSMHDIDRLVVALIESLDERLGVIDTQISKLGEESEPHKTTEAKIAENRKQWAKLGPLSTFFGKHKNLLNAQAEALIVRYTSKTRLEGYRFSRDLIKRLIQDLNVLSSDITRCKRLISEAGGAFKTATECRLNDRGTEDIGKAMVRQYRPSDVRTFVRRMICDSTIQRKQTSVVRDQLIKLLGDRQTFANFEGRITQGVLEDTLSASCKDSAVAAHSDVVALNPELGRILDVSLIDLLRREYDSNEQALKQYTRNIMNMAKNYLKLADSQKQLVGPGIPASNDPKNAICVTFITIIAPEAPEAVAFRDRFCDALRGATSNGIPVVVTNESRPQEITIVSITSVFPARFVAVVEYLKQEYERRLHSSNAKRAFLELHSEGESYRLSDGQELYDLYAETYKPEDVLPWMMLAQTLGIVKQGKDYETGRDRVELLIVNKDGLADKVVLGADVTSVLSNADPSSVEELENQVQIAIKGDYLRVEKRNELAATLLQRVRSTGDAVSVDAPRYKQEVAAYSVIRKILELGD